MTYYILAMKYASKENITKNHKEEKTHFQYSTVFTKKSPRVSGSS